MGKAARLGHFAAAVVAASCMTAMAARDLHRAERSRIVARLQAHDNTQAAKLIERYLEGAPDDSIMLYNAACVQCRLGEPDHGAALLSKAIKAGFADFSVIRRDPDLRPLREHPIYRAIIAAREAADGLMADRRMQRWRWTCTDSAYRFEIDQGRNLGFVSALDDDAHRGMRAMLDEQAAHLACTLFESPRPLGFVVIVIPTPDDARTLLTRANVTGLYNHRRGDLVTADPQRSLRHEFVHVLHHSHMDALGQQHPRWIQEGLALLYESYRIEPDGSVRFAPNDRQALVAMLARTGRLIPWTSLFSMSPAQLDAESARTYPQLRSIFRFLADSGRLQGWYHTYTGGFDDDPNAAAALEAAFGLPRTEIETRWRAWLETPRGPA